MTPQQAIETLRNSGYARLDPGEPVVDIDALAASLAPHFGTIQWIPPATYRELLALGAFTVAREDPTTGLEQEIRMLGPGELASTNEDLVHLPEGVSIDEGVYLSTNHLVGFAEAGTEAVWCFDVTGGHGGDYPVYYHHQDEPRARLLATGAWADPQTSTPDFPSFGAWLDAMVVAFTAEPAELPAWFAHLGEPMVTFTRV